MASLQSDNTAKDQQLHDALTQIRNISKDLVESRRAVQNLSKHVSQLEHLTASYETKYGTSGHEQQGKEVRGGEEQVAGRRSAAAACDDDERDDQARDREITRLRAVLTAHGIPVDERSTVVTTTDANVVQLLGRVLNVPVAQITPQAALLEPMLLPLNDVPNEKVGLLLVDVDNQHHHSPGTTAVPMDE